MKRYLLDENDRKTKFGLFWLLGTAVSGAVGCYSVVYFGSLLANLKSAEPLIRFFISHSLVYNVIFGAFCASLFQGWLLGLRDISFRLWTFSSVLGYGGGIVAAFLAAFFFPPSAFFSAIFVISFASILQARRLRGHAELPYAWTINLTVLMILMNGVYIGSATLMSISSADVSELNSHLSIQVGIIFALISAYSLHKTEPKFETNFQLNYRK